MSVSCTGFMIPALDAYVADALCLGPRLVRLPITESGCAGGVVGLARATDYLEAHPDRAALVLAVEFSSLTFQRWDRSATNVVSTAIFGDGGAAVVLVGADHPARRGARARGRATPRACSSGAPPTSWASTCATRACRSCWTAASRRSCAARCWASSRASCAARGLAREDVTRWILHPGGRRIIEVMSERLGLREADLAPTEAVLVRARQHELGDGAVRAGRDPARRTGPRPGERGVHGRVRARLRRRVRPAGVLLSGAVDGRPAPAREDPELLDEGVPDDEARRSLGDLRFVNRWLGNRSAARAPCARAWRLAGAVAARRGLRVRRRAGLDRVAGGRPVRSSAWTSSRCISRRPRAKVGKYLRFRLTEVEAWLAQHRRGARHLVPDRSPV